MDDIVSGIDFSAFKSYTIRVKPIADTYLKPNAMKKKTYESPVVTVHHVYPEDSLFCTSSSKEEAEETEIEVDNTEGNGLQGSSNFRSGFMDGNIWE